MKKLRQSHGGKREGAGRKPKPVKREVHGIRCTNDGWQWLNDQAHALGHKSVGKWADARGRKGKD